MACCNLHYMKRVVYTVGALLKKKCLFTPPELYIPHVSM